MGLGRALRAARRLRAGRAVVIHADAQWLPRIAEGRIDLFHKLEAKVTAEGWPMLLVAHGSRKAALLDQRPADIRLIRADAPEYTPRTLHLYPSDIWGFWHLDEPGIRAHSSLRFGGLPSDHPPHAKTLQPPPGIR